jgi:hypothetical protein
MQKSIELKNNRLFQLILQYSEHYLQKVDNLYKIYDIIFKKDLVSIRKDQLQELDYK